MDEKLRLRFGKSFRATQQEEEELGSIVFWAAVLLKGQTWLTLRGCYLGRALSLLWTSISTQAGGWRAVDTGLATSDVLGVGTHVPSLWQNQGQHVPLIDICHHPGDAGHDDL